MLKKFYLVQPAIKKHKSGWLTMPVIVKDLVTIDEILAVTCQVLGINVKDLQEAARTRIVSDARSVFCYYSRLLTSNIHQDIGDRMNKDHTSSISANRLAEDLLDTRDELMISKINIVGKALKKLMNEKV